MLVSVVVVLSARAGSAGVGLLTGWVSGVAAGLVVFALVSSVSARPSGAGCSHVDGAVGVALGVLLVGGGLPPAQLVAVAATCTTVSASTLALPLLARLLPAERSSARLASVRDWLRSREVVLAAAVLIVVGLVLAVRGLLTW